jgi:hypothetical protein
MNIVQSVRMYITKMCDESGPGMKLLLMDKETVSFVVLVFNFKSTKILNPSIFSDKYRQHGIQSVRNFAKGGVPL